MQFLTCRDSFCAYFVIVGSEIMSNQLNIDPLCLPNNPTCGENEVALSNFLFCYFDRKEMNCSAPAQEHVLICVNLRYCARFLPHLLAPSVFQSCPRTRYQQLGPAKFSYLRLWLSIRSMYLSTQRVRCGQSDVTAETCDCSDGYEALDLRKQRIRDGTSDRWLRGRERRKGKTNMLVSVVLELQ